MEGFFSRLVDPETLVAASPLDSISFLIALVVALLFGMMLSLLYNLYFHENEPQDASLSRSLVLLTPALTSIFWMIQFSVPISIGLIGALSFVRFRTPVKRPEDVTFIVISMAVAIACATSAYLIAFALIGVFMIFSFARNRFASMGFLRKRFAIITFNTKKKATMSDIEKLMSQFKISHEIVSSRTYDEITSFVINFSNLNGDQYEEINKALRAYDSDAHINVFYPNERLGS